MLPALLMSSDDDRARAPVHAMILCAGLGSRLRPLTLELPKPLVPVGDRPLLAHIAQQLARAGHRGAVANTHHLHDKFISIVVGLPIALKLIHEPEIRGVAGGIAGARALAAAPLVVCNGDILIDGPPLAELSALADRTGGVCLAVAPARGRGTVGLGADDRIVRLRDESHGVEVRSGDYVGLSAFGAKALAELPDEGCLIGDYCLPRLRRGLPVYSCPASARWWDVGQPESYLAANLAWLARHENHDAGSYVHATAQVDAAVRLEQSVIGAGARVTGSGLLARSVVWPGAHAEAPLTGSVVARRHTLSGVVR